MKNQHFQKYRSKLKIEGILKAVLCGLAVGFGANFVASLACWLAGFEGIWLSLVIFFGVSLITAPIFYFSRFRPSDVTNARRLDRLGLEERLITMVEYDKDDSFIAKAQREDAKRALSTVDKKQIKLKISKSIVAAAVSLAILGTGMTTVNALSEQGILPGGDELIDSIIEDQMTVYVTVSYVIEEGGIIEGDEEQVIVLGTNATTVTAVADEGYMFKTWSDGSTDPTRTDVNVTEDVVYVAIFVEVGDEGDEGEGDGEGEPGDEPSDAPGESDPEEGQDGQGSPPDSGDGTGAQGGGQYDPNNQFFDGESYYRQYIEDFQDMAYERFQGGDESFSQAEMEFILKYLGIV